MNVAAEWADVESVLTTSAPVAAPAAAPARIVADLSKAMRSAPARRDLRRLLIAFGAIGAPKPERPAKAGDTALTGEVVGMLMSLPEEVLVRTFSAAGAISDKDRVQRFAQRVHTANQLCSPTDPEAVLTWVLTVAAILRDDDAI